MEDKPHSDQKHLDLVSTFASLETEYRVYRRAADRFHLCAEEGFVRALNLLVESADGGEAIYREAVAGQTHHIDIGPESLTNREIQVLRLIAAGNSTKQAAAVLGISFKTASGHRSQLMKKLQIHDTASLVRFAIRFGIVEP